METEPQIIDPIDITLQDEWDRGYAYGRQTGLLIGYVCTTIVFLSLILMIWVIWKVKYGI